MRHLKRGGWKLSHALTHRSTSRLLLKGPKVTSRFHRGQSSPTRKDRGKGSGSGLLNSEAATLAEEGTRVTRRLTQLS
jgi:hypothetical protein